jgi:molybdate transport system regulatory protein
MAGSKTPSRRADASGGRRRASPNPIEQSAAKPAEGAAPARGTTPEAAASGAPAAVPAPQSRSANRLSIRVDLSTGARIGPGKVAVLEEIARSGSISAAGRALRISYRRTWELVEDQNASLGAPVVQTAAGGSGGGGASLTELGQAVVTRYRAIEVDCAAAARKHMAALQRVTRSRRPG